MSTLPDAPVLDAVIESGSDSSLIDENLSLSSFDESPLRLELSKRTADAVDQAYQEFCMLRDSGEVVDADEFCSRFPNYRSSLGRLLFAHLLLEARAAEQVEVCWPKPGEVFLDYKIILELGEGAFARVFLAREPKLGNRLVAVKVSQFGSIEAETLGRNPHPNIMPVFSVKTDPTTGLTAVCMPYLGSTTLHGLLDQVELPSQSKAQAKAILDLAGEVRYPLESTGRKTKPDPVLANSCYLDGVRMLCAKIAEALSFLHERGICHRDLKPSNVLITPEGEPMLLDFNLSSDRSQILDLIGGTYPYMSPEQLRATGQPKLNSSTRLDGRSDIFSLGVLLFLLATGKHPFGPLKVEMTEAELCEHMNKRHQQGAPAAHEVNLNVDVDLSNLIQRCLAYSPDDRPQSAVEVATLLRRQLAPLARGRRWLARRPRLALASGLMFVALCVGTIALAATRAPIHERQAQNGSRLYAEGQYQEAIEAFNEALRGDPNNSTVLFARGRAMQRLGKYDLALLDFREADRLRPDGRTKAAIGYCLAHRNEVADATTYFTMAIKAGYVSAETYADLAYGLYRANRNEEAKHAADQAIRLNPNLQSAYHLRALLALRTLGSRVFGLKPDSVNTEAYQQVKAAITDLEQSLKCGDGWGNLHLDAARLYACAARVDKRWTEPALRNLEKAVKQGCSQQSLQDPLLAPIAARVEYTNLVSQAGSQELPFEAKRWFVDPVSN